MKLRGLGFGLAGPLTAAFLAAVVVSPARADCDVHETGVAEVAVPMDFSGIRKSQAENGLAIGGYYAAETFGNPTGGFKQGATYDGVLELHLNADMRKLGLWKGLCFYTDAFQIHGRSITADYVQRQTPIAQNFPNCAMGVNREPCALGGVWSCPSATTHHFFCLKSLML